MKIKIWHISDTHGHHADLKEPDDIDLIIHSGDASNSSQSAVNNNEMLDFLDWSSTLSCPYKIYVAGNHETSVERGLITKDDFARAEWTYLQDEYIELFGFNIWGSPWTPSFGNWSFMRKRGKLTDIYHQAPFNTDIWIQHGPPKGILDLSRNREDVLEMCGCKELLNTLKIVRPLLFCCGHIHDFKDCINQGLFTHEGTIYSNAACVTDAKFELGCTSNGNIITLEK